GHNDNTASNTLSINYDITKPTVASVTVPADKYYTAGQVMNFTVNFTEDIILNTAGSNPYLTLTIGTTTMNANYTGVSTARALSFSYTVVNGDNDMDGITVNSLALNGSTIKDLATNDAVPTLNNIGNTANVRVSTSNPTVILSSAANALLNTPFTVTAAFSESITGLTAGDFTITNGTAGNLQTTDNITYTFTVTPATDGVVSILLPANAAVNTGGNGNTVSNTLNFTYDNTAPMVNAVTVPANGYYKAGDVMNFTVSFSENIQLNTSGAPYLNIILNSGTVKAAYTTATANSLVFSYTVQPGNMDPDGIALGTLALNGAVIKDVAGNNAVLTLNNVGNTSGVFIQTGSPSVQLSAAVATRVNAPFMVTVVFNEAVTGLAAGDFTVTNGTAGNLQTIDNITYTVTITPASDGTVTIQLPADQAQNAGANGNTASNTLTATYDATAPIITSGLAFSILERSSPGTLAGKVTATETAGSLQNWIITADDSNGAFSIDANGNILVKDLVKLNSRVNTIVTLAITVSDGLNTSAAVPATIQVKAVNQAPTLAAIDDITICPDGGEHTIQLNGASAVEAGQTYSFSIFTNKAANFDKLSISVAGLITYQLKGNATGISSITVTIRDNGGTANGGTDTLRRSFNMEVATLGAITISSDKGNNISKGDIVQLSATGGTSYQWDNADGIISDRQSAVLKVRPMQNTTYRVTASNSAGCSNTADFTVTVMTDFKVDAVNLLTPNGDGKNDKWVIRNLDSYPNNEVKIFDRTGRLVYTRRNYSNDWDGTMNGSPLAEGTYYYILTIDGGAKTAKGYITIIRDRN
ncbi:gliding motility-associated C-terminal domain-containing protein, partial [Chitinophaga sp.]|uniref:T9SS type B sorting domain-containing protein n=1 Tax=Chitinophaga sp. TaxID=1869181 RepID=UPI002F9463B4